MHYFQQRYLRENAVFPGATGLLTIDLPNKGLLSGIEMRVWGTCGAGANLPDVWLHDRITRVEVMVNGSQVVKSYDARQLLAMMLYKRTPHYSHDMKNTASDSAEEFFYINLGRWYHDLEYMLDLGQVADPELRLTFNFDMTGCSNWNCGVAMPTPPFYSIICHMLRDTALVPKGYIKTSEIHRVDNAANLNYNMTVPRGPKYSNLYLQSWYRQMGLTAVIDHVEVNINSDDIIPYRIAINDVAAQNTRMYGLMETTQRHYALGSQAYPTPMEYGHVDGEIYVGGTPDSELVAQDLWGLFNAIAYRRVATGVVAADTQVVRLTYRGTFPFAMTAIPLFAPWDPDTWIDTSVLGDFWVRIEEGAGATAGVMKLLGDEVVTKYTTPSWP